MSMLSTIGGLRQGRRRDGFEASIGNGLIEGRFRYKTV